MTEQLERLKFARAFVPADERYITEFTPPALAVFTFAHPPRMRDTRIKSLVFVGMHSFFDSMPDIQRPAALATPLMDSLLSVQIEPVIGSEQEMLRKLIGNWRTFGTDRSSIAMTMGGIWTPPWQEQVESTGQVVESGGQQPTLLNDEAAA